MKEFLPKDEKIPASGGNYMRFESGENRFRILSSAITGLELWVDRKPIRHKTLDQFTSEQLAKADINTFTGSKKTPTYFWAFPVYNYKTGKVEILEITQKTIMNSVMTYLDDPDYGREPWLYDFVVTRDDNSDPVQYLVRAKPPKEIEKEVKELCDEELSKIDLTALYRGEDPFSTKKVDDSSEDIPFE